MAQQKKKYSYLLKLLQNIPNSGIYDFVIILNVFLHETYCVENILLNLMILYKF